MPTAKERTAGKLSDTRAGLGGPLVLACLRSDSVNNSDQKRNDSNSEEVLSRNEVRSVEHNLKAESDSSPEISPVVDREDRSRSETSEMKADSCDSQRIRGDSGCDVQDYEGLIELFGVENSYRRDAELGSDKEVSFVADQDVQPRSGTGETENDLCGSQKAQSDLDEDESKTSVQVFSLGKNRYTTGDEGLLLEVRLNDKSMVLLIDTGSEVSVLKRESFENLSEATIDAAQVKLRAVNGGCFPVDGKTMVYLDVTGKETSSMERFLIADISKSFDVDGILGLDILKPHKVQVDLEKGRLKYDGMWIPCVGSEDEEYVCTLSADVIVEPRCAALLKASLGSYGSLGDTQMVEPFQNVLSEEGVLSCCSLQRIDGLVKIPVVEIQGCDVQDYEGLAELFRDEESQALKSELDSDLAILLVVDQEDQSRSGTGEMRTDLCDSQGVNPDSGFDVQDDEGLAELFRDEESQALKSELDSDRAILLVVDQEDQSRSGTGEMGTDLCDSQGVNPDSDGTDVYVAIARVYSLGKDSYRSGDRDLLVEVKVNERSMVLLIDTGSEVSVLRRESFENLSEVDLDSAHVKLRAVNGSSFPVVGKIKVSLDVMGNGCSSKEIFLIADISKSFDVDGILGLDVLKKHSVQVDLEEDKIEYDGVWVSCLGSKDKKQTHVTPTDTGVEKSCDALFSENKETGTVLPVEQAVQCHKVTKEEAEVNKEPKPPWYNLVKCSPSGKIPRVEQNFTS